MEKFEKREKIDRRRRRRKKKEQESAEAISGLKNFYRCTKKFEKKNLGPIFVFSNKNCSAVM